MESQDRINADLNELRAQVADIGAQLNTALERAKKEGGSFAQAELSQLQERVQTLMGDMKAAGRQAYSRAENTVKEHPGTSLITAFALGALVALIMRR